MQVGDSYEVRRTVTDDMTAEALGSGGLRVLGTPYLAAMMENAAYLLLQKELPESKSSVGASIALSHVSPTPVGMEVRVAAEVADVLKNGRMIDFKLTAYDAAGLIGEGTHRRAVIDVERFTAACQAKLLSNQ